MEDWFAPYLAGVVDCDGSIQVMRTLGPIRKRDGRRPHYYLVRVTVTQVEPRIHEVLKARLGGCVYRYERANGGKGYWNTWTVSHTRAASVLRMVLPFLIQKKAQAESALQLVDLMLEQNSCHRPGDVISIEEEAKRLALLMDVRAHNARPRAARHGELLVGDAV